MSSVSYTSFISLAATKSPGISGPTGQERIYVVSGATGPTGPPGSTVIIANTADGPGTTESGTLWFVDDTAALTVCFDGVYVQI